MALGTFTTARRLAIAAIAGATALMTVAVVAAPLTIRMHSRIDPTGGASLSVLQPLAGETGIRLVSAYGSDDEDCVVATKGAVRTGQIFCR